MTMDGKIATKTGASKWITGETARKRVHEERHKNMAIMVGIGTVRLDNPSLTTRLENYNAKNPIRIICDTHLATPLAATVVTTAKEQRTILATCCKEQEKWKPYEDAGCEILLVKEENGRINLKDLMIQLGKMGIDSILLEGGGTLNEAALRAGIVKKVQTYIAPKIFGGDTAKSPVAGIGANVPNDAFFLKNTTIEKIGEDFLLESEVVTCSPEL